MKHSTTYFEIQSLIEKSWLVQGPSEIDQWLKQVEQEGKITTTEHNVLLRLYMKINDPPLPQ